jgi:N-acetylneuraminic acid mutarotase
LLRGVTGLVDRNGNIMKKKARRMIKKRNRTIGVILIMILSACSTRADDTPLAEAELGEWQQHAHMPAPRSEMPAAVLDGRIYVPGGFGGESVFEAYEPSSDSWHSLADLPGGRHHLMAAAHDGLVYVFGGARSIVDWRATDSAWSYDPETDTWRELGPMPEARLSGAAVSLGEYIFVIGGTGGSNAVLRYDPAADEWSQLAPLAEAREHTAAAALDRRIYAIAGRWTGTGELTSVEVYDPDTDTWSPGPPLSEARGGHAAAVIGDRIVVAGGEVLSGARRTLDSVEVLDPAQGSWVSATDCIYKGWTS